MYRKKTGASRRPLLLSHLHPIHFSMRMMQPESPVSEGDTVGYGREYGLIELACEWEGYGWTRISIDVILDVNNVIHCRRCAIGHGSGETQEGWSAHGGLYPIVVIKTAQLCPGKWYLGFNREIIWFDFSSTEVTWPSGVGVSSRRQWMNKRRRRNQRNQRYDREEITVV